MIILYSYNVSPYAAKVRAILRYKRLPFDERLVHPFKRDELERLSGQNAVPVLVDGARAVADSTRIARFLDEAHPERPVLPRDPAARARALLVEDWADEALPRAVQPVRWLYGKNAARTLALFRSAYPAGRGDDLAFAVIGRALRIDQHRKWGSRTGRLAPSTMMERLALTLDLIDGALAETGFLGGPEPTVADFAAWGFLHFLDGLDGWEAVQARKRVSLWLKTMTRLQSQQI